MIFWLLEKVWPRSPRDKAHDELTRGFDHLIKAYANLDTLQIPPGSDGYRTQMMVKTALIYVTYALESNHDWVKKQIASKEVSQ